MNFLGWSSLSPAELGTVCTGNKAAALSFMCRKTPQLQLSKGNCLQTGRLHVLQFRKDYLSVLFPWGTRFSLQTGLSAQELLPMYWLQWALPFSSYLHILNTVIFYWKCVEIIHFPLFPQSLQHGVCYWREVLTMLTPNKSRVTLLTNYFPE